MLKRKIVWCFFDKTLIFNLNWFEYWVVKNILLRKKYEIQMPPKDIIVGESVKLLFVDEVTNRVY
jgi:hypothetical protein